MARAGGRSVRVCLLPGLLPRSVVASSQLRHGLFQRRPMAVNGSQLGRHCLDVGSWRGGCGLRPMLLAARLPIREAPMRCVWPLDLNVLELLLRCFQPLKLLHALLRSCRGLLHLLNALLRSVSFLQTLSGSLDLLDALLRPLQRGLRLPVVSRALATGPPVVSFRVRRRNDEIAYRAQPSRRACHSRMTGHGNNARTEHNTQTSQAQPCPEGNLSTALTHDIRPGPTPSAQRPAQ